MKRLFVALIVLALLPSTAGAAPSIDYRCAPGGLHSCDGWYRVPVEVTWIYNTGDSEPFGGECLDWIKKTFTADTRGTDLSCDVWNPANHAQKAGDGMTIHIDKTAPTVTGPGLGRPPDNGDWFNHPVAFGFTGQDGTSGIQSCTTGTYSGPEGTAVGVSGSCRDVAGNVTARTFTINYDSTPPPEPDVSVLPGNRRVALRWKPSQYVAEVVRLAAAGSQSLVQGGASGFTDRGLRNGRRYRYAVTFIDQAGNRSTDRVSAVPTSSRLLLPAAGAHLSTAPELVWKPVRKASYYNAQLLHRGRKVLSRWPVDNRLQLPKLRPGRYCWYVWPGMGKRRLHNYGHLLGRSCFRITG